MTDRLKQFYEEISANEEMKTEFHRALKGVKSKDRTSRIIEFAELHNFELNEDDFTYDGNNLNMEEINALTGTRSCNCTMAGEGKSDELECSCFLSGSGNVEKSGKKASIGGCACVGAGFGSTGIQEK